MNIFFLSLDPSENARMNCDQHVVKIQLEIAQMLYMAWHFAGQESFISQHAPYTKDKTRRGYRPAHPKHPMTMWIASSIENYYLRVRLEWHSHLNIQNDMGRYTRVQNIYFGFMTILHLDLKKG